MSRRFESDVGDGMLVSEADGTVTITSGASSGAGAIVLAGINGVNIAPGQCVNFSTTARGCGTFTAVASSTVSIFLPGSGIGQSQTVVLFEYASGTTGGVGKPFVTSKDGHSTIGVFCPSGNTAVYNYVTFNIDPQGPF